MNRTWTDEQVDQLRALWAQGVTGPKIAQLLGTTRDAVTAKARKLDLEWRGRQRVADKTTEAMDRVAQHMADGCLSIAQCARDLGMTQSYADQVWQRIRRDLGPQAV